MTANNKSIAATEPVKQEAIMSREFEASWKKEIDEVFNRLAKMLEKLP
jgi:hypothetical protein